MADDDDLPDHHYESIYGREALMTRLTARVAALERAYARRVADDSRRPDRLPPTPAPLPHDPTHYTYAVQYVPARRRYRGCVAEFPTLTAHAVTPQGTLTAIMTQVRRHLE